MLINVCFYLIKFFIFREQQSIELPPLGAYATGIFYLDKVHHSESEAAFDELAKLYKLKVCYSHLEYKN